MSSVGLRLPFVVFANGERFPMLIGENGQPQWYQSSHRGGKFEPWLLPRAPQFSMRSIPKHFMCNRGC